MNVTILNKAREKSLPTPPATQILPTILQKLSLFTTSELEWYQIGKLIIHNAILTVNSAFVRSMLSRTRRITMFIPLARRRAAVDPRVRRRAGTQKRKNIR